MREEDLPRVLEIERTSFSDPWSRASFLYEIRDNPFAENIVLRDRVEAGRVVAYSCLWCIGAELHINNVAVAPEERRQGLGRRLVQGALDLGARRGCRSAVLQVRPSNEAALDLYHSLGFTVTGRRRRYYSDTREDAILMSRRIDPPISSGASP